ncbi:axin [Diaphorina citri]|uniref:Axin n=1 Tax=Diaphorina citri TaxID=121845 RepID=A0A3Q0J1H5_DIACI|nr:axin [Diaphorina citri]
MFLIEITTYPPPDGFAPLGFEPEGGSDSSPSPSGGGEALSTSPPNYLEWAKSFNNLLNDPEGLHLFRKYLASENQSDLLEFWFACEGLKKQTNQDQINLIVKCIYRRYFKDSRLGLSEECLSSVLEDIRAASRTSPNLSSRMFAESQLEVERIINVVVYRNFLQSDIYLNYIHHMTQDSCSGSTTGSSSGSHAGAVSQASQSTSQPDPPQPRQSSASDNQYPHSYGNQGIQHTSSAASDASSHSTRNQTSSNMHQNMHQNMHSSGHQSNMHHSSGPNMHDSSGHQSMHQSNMHQSGHQSNMHQNMDLMSKSCPTSSSLALMAPQSGHPDNHPRASSSPIPSDIVSDALSSLTEDLASSLPTLHEDSEDFDYRNKPLPPGPKLTKDSLLATARKRTMLRSKPEAFAGMFLKHGPQRANPYSLTYNSYNPVSRHDSDIASLSSDARSGSDLSLNTSGLRNRPSKHHGGSHSNQRNSEHTHPPKARAIMNKEENLHNTIIPRTLLKNKVPNMKPKEFADLLISKLTAVKKDRDTDERLLRSLNEVPNMKPKEFADLLISKLTAVKKDRDTDERLLRSLNEGPIGDSSTGLSTALSERFPHCPEDDQDILDQHIESVFDKIGLSPGFTTPSRPKSPESNPPAVTGLPPRLPKGALPPPPPLPLLPKVGVMGAPPPPPHAHQVPMTRLDYLKHHKSHRDRDGTFSIFTSDSGNVQDMTDGTETLLSYGNSGCYGNNAGGSLPKSKSMPDYSASFGDQGLASCSRQGSRRYIAKRSDSQIFDSGISGISCSTNATPAPPAPALVPSEQPEYLKNRNVAQWLMESSASSTGVTETKNTSSTCTRLRHTITVKHKSGPGSCSSERPEGVECLGQDAPLPDVADEQDSGDLGEDLDVSWAPSNGKPQEPSPINPAMSNSCTLRSVTSTPRPPEHQSGTFTTVVFTFCDEQYPYRTKIPSQSVTLKQFKDYLPKKGNYRFFFKTECDDVDTKVIQEEIVDDNEVLPLWEGKVMGQVKPLENENMGHY